MLVLQITYLKNAPPSTLNLMYFCQSEAASLGADRAAYRALSPEISKNAVLLLNTPRDWLINQTGA